MSTADEPAADPGGTSDSGSAAPSAKEYLTDWFTRLTESGFDSAIFSDGLADDVVWTATGSSPVSGTFHGKADYLANVFQPLNERLVTWPTPQVLRILADGDWGLVEFNGVGGVGTNGTDYSLRYCWLMRVGEGKVREVIGYYDQTKVAALFA